MANKQNIESLYDSYKKKKKESTDIEQRYQNYLDKGVQYKVTQEQTSRPYKNYLAENRMRNASKTRGASTGIGALLNTNAKQNAEMERISKIDIKETQAKIQRIDDTVKSLRQRGSAYDFNANPKQYEAYWRQVTDLESIRNALEKDVQLAAEYKVSQDRLAQQQKENERSASLDLNDLYKMRDIYTRQQEANASQKAQYDPISNQKEIDDIIRRDKANQEQLDAVNRDIYYRERMDQEQKYADIFANSTEEQRQARGLTDKTYSRVNDAYGNENAYDLTNFMTNEERQTYNAIVAQNGSAGLEAGQEYLDYLEPILNERRANRQTTDISNSANKHKLQGAFLNASTGAIKPLGYAYTVAQGMTDRATNSYTPVDVNSNWFAGSIASEAAAEGVTRDMSGLGKFLAETGMSIGQNLALLPFGQASLAFMGASSAADTARDVLKRGGSTEDAIYGGAAAGFAEVLFEKVSLDNLIKIKDSGSLRDIVSNVLQQAGVEASEEAFTEITNTISDILINKENSNFEMNVALYMAQGMTEEEARAMATKDVAKEIGLAMASGFLSGGVMGGGGTVAGVASSMYDKRVQNLEKTGAKSRFELGEENIVTLAKEMGVLSDKNAEKLGETPTDRQLGKLVEKTGKAIVKARTTAIEIRDQLRATDNEITRKDSAKLARVFEGFLSKGDVSKSDKALLGKSKTVEEVVANLAKIDKDRLSDAADHVNISITKGMTEKDIQNAIVEFVRSNEMNIESEQDVALASADDGQAYITSSKENVDITGVASIQDGKVLLSTESGDLVDAKDVTYGSPEQAAIYQSIVNMRGISAESANTLINAYKSTSMNAAVYANAIKEAYTLGTIVAPAAELKLEEGFAKDLPRNIRDIAYNEGKKAADTIYKPTNKQGRKTGGKVIFDDGLTAEDIKRLNAKQKSGLEGIEMLSRIMGNEWHIVKSYMKNGQRVIRRKDGVEVAANGMYYQNGDIYIDLFAGRTGNGTVLFTAAHEVTHFIRQWSPDKFRVLAEFLNEQYGKRGVSVAHMVAVQQRKSPKLSYIEAYEEFVADSMEKMLADGKVIEKLAELKQRDLSLWEKIKEFFTQLADKIRRIASAYEDAGPDTAEGSFVAHMGEAFEQLQNLFAEGIYEASQNYSLLATSEVSTDPMPVEEAVKYSYKSLAEAAGFEAVENDDGTRAFVRDGVKVTEVTIADIDNSPIGAMINYSLEQGDISDEDAKRQKQMFADICTMATQTNDFAMTMQFVGSAVFTGMKANADAQYGTTYDFPSICTKTQAVIDAMSARMVKQERGLSHKEILGLYREVFASGNPVPCPECYVFSRWIGIGGLLDNIKKYQDYYGAMSVEEAADAYRKMRSEIEAFAKEQGLTFGKAKGALTSKLNKEFNKLTEKTEKQTNQGEKVTEKDLQRLEELKPMMNTVKAMTWLENVYFADASLTKVKKNFRVPPEVLFDLNNGGTFASKYPEAWAFRTTQGAGYGKAITPYADAVLGEGILATNNTTKTIKDKAGERLNNIFLEQKGTMDAKAKKALATARAKQNNQAFIGGQRFQSTSDARYENASDYLLAALEMQAMRGMVQVYTKVDGAVPAFSAWGFSINQSLMPLGGGLKTDGSLSDTAVGGMSPRIAFENRKNHVTAGTITIGVNDNHVRKLINDKNRDFVIPYHASGGKADLIAEFRLVQDQQAKRETFVRSTDYSRVQSEKVLSDDVLRWMGKTDAEIEQIHQVRKARLAILTRTSVDMDVVRSNRFLSALYDKLHGGEWDGVKQAKGKMDGHIFPNEFWDQSVSYEDSAKITRDYLEYCDDLGYLHKFSGTVPKNGILIPVNGYDENGNRVQLTDLAYKYDANGNMTNEVEDFYWKLLTDRRMYDNEGNYLPQMRVTLNDTQVDTVTSFAKNNYGRQYDKATSKRIADMLAERTVEALEASDAMTKFSLREEAPPQRTLNKVYKVFRVADGKLYPPKIANLTDDESLNVPLSRDPRKGKSRVTATGNDTPVGVWLNADVGGIAVDENGEALLNKNGRIKVYDLNGMTKDGFSERTTLAFRPGWHLGSIPEAIQFLLGDGTMPDDLVYAECEISADIDYQAAAMSYGVRESGAFVHADAGLPAVPVDGYYKYKTNPKTDTHPWYIAGAIKVNRIIGDAERREICAKEGITIAPRTSGKDIEPTDIWASGQPTPPKDLTPYKKSQKNIDNDALLERTLAKIKKLSDADPRKGYIQREIDFNSKGIIEEIEKAKLDVDALKSAYEKHGYNPYYFDSDTEVINYYTLSAKRDMPITKIVGDATQFVGMSRDDIVEEAIKILRENSQDDDGVVRITNIDTGRSIVVGKKSIRHGLDRNFEYTALVSYNLKSYLENAIRVNELFVDDGRNFESDIYLGYGETQTGEKVPAYFVVAKLKTGLTELVEFGYLYSIRAKKIEEDSTYGSQGFQPLTSSTISIMELIDAVKEMYSDIIPKDVTDRFGIERRKTKIGESVKFSIRDSDQDALTSEWKINLLREEIDNLRDRIMFEPNQQVESKIRKLQNELNVLLEEERKATKRTPLSEVLNNLDRYRMSDLKSIADQLSRSAWDYEYDISREELIEGIREIINDREEDMSPIEMQAPRYGVWVREPVGNVKMQTRSEDGPSNREILVNALMETAQNDAERAQLSKYAKQIGELNSLENRLTEINAELKRQSFSKGNRNKQALSDLKTEKTMTENRIDILDKKLLRLEASKPLKDIVDRAKKRAILRERAKGKEAMQDLRNAFKEKYKADMEELRQKSSEAMQALKAEQKQEVKDIMQKNRESRARDVDSRRKTQMRARILQNAKELRKLLVRGDKKRNIKQGQQDAVESAVNLAEVLFSNEGLSNEMLAKTMSPEIIARYPDVEKYVTLITKRDSLIESLNEITDSALQNKMQKELNKVNRNIYALNKSLDEVFKGERRARSEGRVTDAINKLATAYESTENSEYSYIASAYDEALTKHIRALSENLKGTIVKDMTLKQLEDVYKIYKMVLHSVREANKAFATNLKMTREQLATSTMAEIKEAGGEHLYEGAARKGINSYLWNNLKPIYAFERIGSDTLMQLYKNIRKGEDVWMRNAHDAKIFQNKLAEKYGFDDWDFDKVYTFTSSTGEEFKLNLEQIMSIYAYSKRESAIPHLTDGGIQIGDDQTLKIDGKKVTASSAKAYPLSLETIGEINKVITEDKNKQMYVDLMQDYLSNVMGAKGNEVSMKLYGVELFGEENYFPIKVSSDRMEKAREQQEMAVKVKSYGFTNSLTPNARATIMLNGFTNTWDNHVQEMSMYHAMTLPMEDFYRVINYKEIGDGDNGVIPALKNAYGEAATKYINDFLKDVNGGVRIDDRMGFVNKLTSKYKKAAVVASLSVAAQQPSSIGRAFALISPKYFLAKDNRLLKTEDRTWEEIKKYAPIAAIKEMGYFDTNMGMGFGDYIHAKEYKGIRAMAKGLLTDSTYRDEALTKLPAWMDEVVWGAIWKAVKRETMATRKDLKLNSKEFLDHCGERFTEIIEKTQVYDSVFSRSSFMRSKNPLAKALTAFLAEPTTSINMLQEAIWKLRKGDKKGAAKVAASVYTSVLLNAVLASFIYAMRDDDEDENFFEKYMQRFATEIVDGVNPIGSLPFLKDIWSVAQGFDIERSDMSLIKDMGDSLQGIVKAIERGEGLEQALWTTADTLGSFFGLPVKNIRRDINGFINFGDTLANGTVASPKVFWDGIGETLKNNLPIVGWFKDKEKSEKLYDAIVSGDTAYINRLKGTYKDEDAFNSAVRSALKDYDPRIKLAAQARLDGDTATYLKYADAIRKEKHFSQDDIVRAINSMMSSLSDSESSSSDSTPLVTNEDYYNAIRHEDYATAEDVKDILVSAIVEKGESEKEAIDSVETSFVGQVKSHYIGGLVDEKSARKMMQEYGGLDAEEADNRLKEWGFESTYGYTWGQRDRAYRLGVIDRDSLIDALMDINGYDYDRAVNSVRYIEAKEEYPELDLTESELNVYYSKVSDSGLTLEEYQMYVERKSGVKGKENIMDVIDSLPISDNQKDALYYLNGWKSSKLYEAPWR